MLGLIGLALIGFRRCNFVVVQVPIGLGGQIELQLIEGRGLVFGDGRDLDAPNS
jgi:hypothetical protein